MRKLKPKIRKVTEIVLLVTLTGSVVIGGLLYHQKQKEKKVISSFISSSGEPETSEDDEKEFIIDWENLKNTNDDVIGWIRVLDTNINYPVVQSNDNDFYLRRNIEGDYSELGSIFMDYRNSCDLTSLNTFIYGHFEYYGDQMFTHLVNYKNQEFAESHQIIHYYTPEKNYELIVFSVHEDDTEGDSYIFDFAAKSDFENYYNEVKSKSVVELDVDDFQDETKVVTLYTCVLGKSTKRLYVHCIVKEI